MAINLPKPLPTFGDEALPVADPYVNNGAASTATSTPANMTKYTWAVALLQSLGSPTTSNNIEFLISWANAEGGNWGNTAYFNPLNTTEPGYGGTDMNSVGVKAYPSWQQGIAATVAVMRNGLYNGILRLLQTGHSDVQQMADAVSSSEWGTGSFSGASAGTQSAYTGAQIVPEGPSGSGSDSVDPYQSAAEPVLSLASLQSADPLVAALIVAVPELKSIFEQAVANTWSSDQLISAVQNSTWWKDHSATARQAIATMYTDPATWNQMVVNLQTTLSNLATSLGAMPTQSQVNSLAIDALMNGYDSNQDVLQQKFSQYVTPASGLHFGGQAGSDEQTLRADMQNMGVWIPQPALQSNLKQIIAGTQSVQGVEAQLRTQSAAKYPAYAQQINQGVNLSDIASPYIQDAQNLLEQGPGQVNLNNPLIQSALTPKTPVSLTDFENTVRQNPQWLQTDNARDSLMSTAHQVLANFGFEY